MSEPTVGSLAHYEPAVLLTVSRGGIIVLVFWRIRYFDRVERQFKDRDLYLVTSALDAGTRAAVELFVDTKTTRNERDIFRFRHLFTEGNCDSFEALVEAEGKISSFALTNYFEDETGNELDGQQLGQLLTGEADCELLPFPLDPHDLELRRSQPQPLPLAEVTLTPEQIKTLGYFCRDLRELGRSAFFREQHPATLVYVGGYECEPEVKTAATDDEIRSAATIFRRLYMADEPANFIRAATLFSTVLKDHPLGKWVGGEAQTFAAKLGRRPVCAWGGPAKGCTFSRQRLIDVFLYTQYHHQPDDANQKPNRQRERQFAECVQEVGGSRSKLTWLFFSELWFVGREILNAGGQVAQWFETYCAHQNLTPNILTSLLHEHPGIGTIEKEADRFERIRGEKTQELAAELCRQSGFPPSETVRFLHQAHERLSKALGPLSRSPISP